MADDQDVQAENLLDRVRQRRDDSLQWFDDNFYGEFVEVNKLSKCRTEPIIVKGRDGKEKEDLTRTNVAYPDAHVMIRRNTARMTANPPSNRYIVPGDPNLFGELGMFPKLAPDEISEALSAWNLMQFNLSGEIREHRLHVQQEETFGWSVMEHFWKTLSVERVFRYQLTETLPRQVLLQATGSMSDEEIRKEVELKGQRLGPDDLPELKARYGKEIIHRTRIPRFNGPTGRMCFIGDMFPEPGFRLLDESPYIIKQSFVEKDWIEDMSDDTYFHPETDEEMPVFDEAQVKLLMDDKTLMDARQQPRGTRKELRAQMWDSIGKEDPDNRRLNATIPGKRFHILAEHTKDDDGRWQVLYVANEKYVLNSIDPATEKPRPVPYPYDLFGMSMFTEMVGLPDIISGIGDSTPRLLRFLMQLRHTVVNQRTDLINNILRRPVLRKNRADLPDQPVERSQFRIYDVKDPNDFHFPNEADIPPGAFEVERSVIGAMQAAEPALSSLETGSSTNPGTGRTATAATLTQRNIEGMMAYKLDSLNLYNGAVAMKKLAMLQQMATEPIKIPARFINGEQLKEKLNNATYELDPYALQCDIEVLPEDGSTLPLDDEFRRMSAENVYRFASDDPMIWNKREAAKMMASTIRGIDPNKIINPPPDPNAPPPPPEIKVSISVQMKFDELQPETQAAVLQRAGLPYNVEDGHAKESLKAAGEVGEAANSVAALAETVGGQDGATGAGASGSAG